MGIALALLAAVWGQELAVPARALARLDELLPAALASRRGTPCIVDHPLGQSLLRAAVYGGLAS